jgi:hypothetical protein
VLKVKNILMKLIIKERHLADAFSCILNHPSCAITLVYFLVCSYLCLKVLYLLYGEWNLKLFIYSYFIHWLQHSVSFICFCWCWFIICIVFVFSGHISVGCLFFCPTFCSRYRKMYFYTWGFCLYILLLYPVDSFIYYK